MDCLGVDIAKARLTQGSPSWITFRFPKNGSKRVDLMQVGLNQGDLLW